MEKRHFAAFHRSLALIQPFVTEVKEDCMTV
jgi:hypothetical protein